LLLSLAGGAAEPNRFKPGDSGVSFPGPPSRFFKEPGEATEGVLDSGAPASTPAQEEIMSNVYGVETGMGSTPDQPKRDWERTADEAALEAEEAAAEVERKARRVADATARKLRNAKESAAAAYERSAESAERAYRGAMDYARQHPGRATAACFALGVGIGMAMSPRSRSNGFGRGLVPVVAIALANAVLDVFDER
jgi:ElaB/YqjD/DUF883 family membrane-anchored ribosome-binding protein